MIFAPVIRRSAHPALRSLDRNLEHFLGQTLWQTPRVNNYKLEEDEQAYTLQLDAPGLKREHLQVDLEGAVVRLQSTQDAPRTLSLALELPQALDVAQSQAKLEDGVLTLKLAKHKPEPQATRIAIQ